MAVDKGQKKIVELLLERDATVINAPTALNKPPLLLALERGYGLIATLLLEKVRVFFLVIVSFLIYLFIHSQGGGHQLPGEQRRLSAAPRAGQREDLPRSSPAQDQPQPTKQGTLCVAICTCACPLCLSL